MNLSLRLNNVNFLKNVVIFVNYKKAQKDPMKYLETEYVSKKLALC